MTVLPHDYPGLAEGSPTTRPGSVLALLLTLLRAAGAVVLPPVAWLGSVILCLAALVLADASTALRAALVVAAAVPAVGSILVSRALMGVPAFSFWVGLGVLPSIAGGWLLFAIL
ncbi:hypothetical protein [Nocardioides ferulae]|uniref:hypothetical protein n=1 Tax=Nocardioides ferulae TaxID=2340821 RepID=UPI000EABF74D|nr:hypothetical protein [Nocardioides ferulae]